MSVMATKKLGNQHIQVFVRCRPPNSLEKKSGFIRAVEVVPDKKEILVNDRVVPERSLRKSFTFDKVFGPEAKQIDVYRAVMGPTIAEVMMGYNCTVFAYGQTGTGKTFTMEGERSNVNLGWADDPLAGIIPRTLHQLFEELQSQDLEFTIKVSFLELYNEELFDLLSAHEDTSRMKIYEDSSRKGSVIIQGLEEITVHNREEVFFILEKGAAKRQTAATLLNATSSRSHTVFAVTVHIREMTDDGEELVKTGKLNLVDLAGSENIGRSGAIDRRAREAGNINQSLLTLGRVITALVDKAPHVPYRESKLTRLLQDSLGGRTKTSIIATISPDMSNLEETLSTLDYAHRAKNITNRPEINQKMTKKALIKEYTEEIERLRRDLAATRDRNGVFVDHENYRNLECRLNSQSQEILEKEAQIESLTERLSTVIQLFEKTKQVVAETTERLEATSAELQDTKMSLDATEQVLSRTSAERDEQAALVRAHSKTEAALTATAEELVGVAKTTTSDIDLLQQKLRRTFTIDQTNRERQSAFMESSKTRFSQVETSCTGQVAAQRDTLTGIGSSFAKLCSLIQQHQAAVVAYMSEARKLADESAAANGSTLSSLQTTVQTLQEQQTAQMATGLATNQARLQRLCQSIVPERTREAQQRLVELEAQQSALADQVLSVCRLFSDKISAHHNQQGRLVASILEENLKLHRQLDARNSEVRRLSAALEQKSMQAEKEVTTFRQNVENFVQFFLSSNALQADSMVKIDELDAKTMEASAANVSAVKSATDELLVSSKGLVSSATAIQESCSKEASDCLAKAQESSLSLSSIHRAVEETVSTEAACLSEALVEQKREAENQMAACIENTSQAVFGGSRGTQCQAEEAKALANKVETKVAEGCIQMSAACQCGTVHTAKVQDGLEALRASVATSMATCSSAVSDFFHHDLQEYVPTGCTPQRREYRFPQDLPQTSPHERILNRLRAATNTAAATALPLPAFDDTDLSAPQSKAQSSSSSTESLTSTVLENKENKTRACKQKKPWRQTSKKQLVQRNI